MEKCKTRKYLQRGGNNGVAATRWITAARSAKLDCCCGGCHCRHSLSRLVHSTMVGKVGSFGAVASSKRRGHNDLRAPSGYFYTVFPPSTLCSHLLFRCWNINRSRCNQEEWLLAASDANFGLGLRNDRSWGIASGFIAMPTRIIRFASLFSGVSIIGPAMNSSTHGGFGSAEMRASAETDSTGRGECSQVAPEDL